jgi:hypothetical protein
MKGLSLIPLPMYEFVDVLLFLPLDWLSCPPV